MITDMHTSTVKRKLGYVQMNHELKFNHDNERFRKDLNGKYANINRYRSIHQTTEDATSANLYSFV